ncbi:hypothetical protein ACMFMG_005180 [Clarireedia jacksonii]
MSIQNPGDPKLLLYLHQTKPDLIFLLDYKSMRSVYLLVRMQEAADSVTLILDGFHEHKQDVITSLHQGILKLMDAETRSIIPIPSPPLHSTPGSLTISNSKLAANIDTTNPFWKGLLHIGRKYELHWSAEKGESWCFYGRTEEGYENMHRFPVSRMPGPITFTAHDSISAFIPKLSISISASAEACHLSSKPPFSFELSITSHSKDIITIWLDKSPLSELHGLEDIVKTIDEETGEEVEWPWVIGCFSPPRDYFPDNSTFEEFTPEVSYLRTFSLDPFDSRTSNGGELESLEVGRKYRVSLNKCFLAGFGKWRRGTKAELLKGTKQEKRKIWDFESDPIIVVDSGGTCTFETVE